MQGGGGGGQINHIMLVLVVLTPHQVWNYKWMCASESPDQINECLHPFRGHQTRWMNVCIPVSQDQMNEFLHPCVTRWMNVCIPESPDQVKIIYNTYITTEFCFWHVEWSLSINIFSLYKKLYWCGRVDATIQQIKLVYMWINFFYFKLCTKNNNVLTNKIKS